MKRIFRFDYLLLILGIAGAIWLFSFSPNYKAQELEVPVPDAAENCVDRESRFVANGAELIASEAVEEVNYYLIYTYQESSVPEQYPSALLVSSKSATSCKVELWNTPGDYLAYANYVPFEAAVKFNQIEYEMSLEKMGREAFINAFDLSEGDLYEEEIEALRRMRLWQEIQASQ